MDENNSQEQGGEDKPHVNIFGMEVDGPNKQSSSNSSSDSGSTSSSSSQSGSSSHQQQREDWRKQKEEWRAQRHAQREQWRQNRQDWHHSHGGGFFWGIILIFGGLIALLYTMGYVSPAFWQVIMPFWPMLLILWGASILLGRHWTARIVLFIVTIVLILFVIIYGLVKIQSPIVNSLPPNVVGSMSNIQSQ